MQTQRSGVSQVLGEELLEEWVARAVPPGERRAWLAANDLTITLFVAPQVLALLPTTEALSTTALASLLSSSAKECFALDVAGATDASALCWPACIRPHASRSCMASGPAAEKASRHQHSAPTGAPWTLTACAVWLHWHFCSFNCLGWQGPPGPTAWGAPTKPPEMQQQWLHTEQPAQEYQYPIVQHTPGASLQQPSAPPYPG